jgi:hypothetical protein
VVSVAVLTVTGEPAMIPVVVRLQSAPEVPTLKSSRRSVVPVVPESVESLNRPHVVVPDRAALAADHVPFLLVVPEVDGSVQTLDGRVIETKVLVPVAVVSAVVGRVPSWSSRMPVVSNALLTPESIMYCRSAVERVTAISQVG